MEVVRHLIIDWSPVALLLVVFVLAWTVNEAVDALKDLLITLGENAAEKGVRLRAELDRYERETEHLFPFEKE